MPSQTKFYFIPKERVANLLNGESRQDQDGSIKCRISNNTKATLSDYMIPEQIVATPAMKAYVGMIGTRLQADCDSGFELSQAIKNISLVLQKYEI